MAVRHGGYYTRTLVKRPLPPLSIASSVAVTAATALTDGRCAISMANASVAARVLAKMPPALQQSRWMTWCLMPMRWSLSLS